MADSKPRMPVRRFDVFAEYNRIKAMKQDKLPLARAKGYGLWLAKVVAAQKFGRLPKVERKKEAKTKEEEEKEKERERKEWHDLSGIPQTDKLFDKEIVGRMGKSFYQRVFSPRVRKAYEDGKTYVEIRDTIRKDWKPD